MQVVSINISSCGKWKKQTGRPKSNSQWLLFNQSYPQTLEISHFAMAQYCHHIIFVSQRASLLTLRDFCISAATCDGKQWPLYSRRDWLYVPGSCVLHCTSWADTSFHSYHVLVTWHGSLGARAEYSHHWKLVSSQRGTGNQERCDICWLRLSKADASNKKKNRFSLKNCVYSLRNCFQSGVKDSYWPNMQDIFFLLF